MVQQMSVHPTVIAKIQFFLQVAVHKENEAGQVTRVQNKYFDRNKSYNVVAIHEDGFELENGLFAKEQRKEQYKLIFGELRCLEKTPVCNRSGTILRYVSSGATFQVTELLNGVVGIGFNEFISLKQPVQFEAVK